jgi:hypothetical protein
MWLQEHRHNFTVGLLENSKLVQHAYVGHKVSCYTRKLGFWKLEVIAKQEILYKGLVHMACLTNMISQPTLGISPNWIALIGNDVIN